jgi:hypothetical protein
MGNRLTSLPSGDGGQGVRTYDRTVTPKVMEYLNNNPGAMVTPQRIAQATGCDGGSVGHALRRLAQDGYVDILARGVYQRSTTGTPRLRAPVTPAPQPTVPEVFELVAQTKSGALLIKGDDGVLYKAEPLDI